MTFVLWVAWVAIITFKFQNQLISFQAVGRSTFALPIKEDTHLMISFPGQLQ